MSTNAPPAPAAAAAANFGFDQRNLPSNLQSTQAQDDFSGKVLSLLQDSASNVTNTSPLYGAVVGMLVLDGYTDYNAANFSNGFWGIRGEAAASTTGIDGTTQIPNEQVYDQAATIISGYAGHNGSVYFQELGEVSRKLIAQASSVPVDGPGFVGQVRVYDDGYTTTGPTGDTLDLPDLTGSANAAPDDIRPDNIRAVAVVYAAYNLEQLRMFDVVDRITETWWNGQLPVGFDGGSRALDEYYWTSEFRLSPAARHMQYGRVLGAPGGEVSTEVQPNTQFNDLFMRLIASLAEYDRQQRIGDIVGGQRTSALMLTGEAVRQAGRNLAANASLYGWGGTQFAARRLAKQVQTSLAILNAPELQAALGVDGPWKMIERVATEYWGGAPNIVKYRTLAESGRDILNLLATYSTIWSGSTGRPLFNDPATGNQSSLALTQLSQNFGMLAAVMASPAPQRAKLLQQQSSSNSGSGSTTTQIADIQDSDRDELMRDAGYIIAVQGIKDDTVSQLSQPAETQYAPSIPTITAAPAAAADGQAGIDQLRQMVTQGQVPSIDQLKSLVLPATTNGQKG